MRGSRSTAETDKSFKLVTGEQISADVDLASLPLVSVCRHEHTTRGESRSSFAFCASFV